MQKRFNQDGINVKACASRICATSLKLCNIKISGKLANKRYAIRSYKESTPNKAKNLKKD